MSDTIKNEVVKATSEYVFMGNSVLKTRFPRACGWFCLHWLWEVRSDIVSTRCCSRSTYVLNDVQKCAADDAQFSETIRGDNDPAGECVPFFIYFTVYCKITRKNMNVNTVLSNTLKTVVDQNNYLVRITNHR